MHRGGRRSDPRDFAWRRRARGPQRRPARLHRGRRWDRGTRDWTRHVDASPDRGPASECDGSPRARRRRPEPALGASQHPAEFGRLANLETSAVQKDRRGIASRFAKSWNKVVVLKGAGTVIAAPDGRITLNPIATPALASGGTGDVLAGLIGGLMAQKLPAFEAAVTGVHLHSLAGIDLEASMGQAGVLASDLLPQIPRVMERLR